jgi:hypothetical protein
MGHAGKDMSDLYDKIEEDVAFRRKWESGLSSVASALNCFRCTECTETRRKDSRAEGSVSN